MQILAVVVAAIMVPVALLVRRPPALAGAAAASGDARPQSEMSLSQAVRTPQFIILLATNFFCCATHSGPIIHTVSYAISCGIPMLAAVSIAGGLIYDTFASYVWLYISAWGMGLGAFLMAPQFRPFPKARVAPVPA